MTPTETARRSDSLYYSGTHKRELCDMVAHREADIQERDELIRSLRHLVAQMHDCVERMREQVGKAD